MADAGSPQAEQPRGEISIRTVAMPSETNQSGDIFGGWLLGQMDIAGNIFAYKVAKGRTVTVAVDSMVFHKPVYVGDVLTVYCDLIKIGHTSISVHVEAWVMRRNEDNLLHVTDGNFTYVAIDDNNHPRQVNQ